MVTEDDARVRTALAVDAESDDQFDTRFPAYEFDTRSRTLFDTTLLATLCAESADLFNQV